MAETVTYLHLPAGRVPRQLGGRPPYKALVVVEQEVANDWRNLVGDWLVETGCLYMMAWGLDCSSWDDSVDWANLERFDFDIPDHAHVMTTWHADEPLEEAMWFAANVAFDPNVALDHTVIIDIVAEDRETELMRMFREAQTGSV